MKILFFLSISSFIAASFVSLALATEAAENVTTLACPDPSTAVPFYRSYNPLGNHFYTTNLGEHESAVASGGYIDEGEIGYIFPRSHPATVPLYRLWAQNGWFDHFYTTSAAERDNVIKSKGYLYEKVAGWVFYDSACGGLPFYRLWLESTTDHFYTTNVWERDSYVGNGGVLEGVAGYIL